MGETIGQEARALGVTQLFAPLGDLARELRYGRVCVTPDDNCKILSG
jgi:beta-glucosidase